MELTQNDSTLQLTPKDYNKQTQCTSKRFIDSIAERLKW